MWEMANVLSCTWRYLMVLVSRDDQSSGMFSSTAANAIRPDKSAADQKNHFLFFVSVKRNKRDVKSLPPPTRGILALTQKALKPLISDFQHWCGADTRSSALSHTCTFSHLNAVLHLHVSQQFPVDTEETKVSLLIVDDAASLRGGLNETRPRAAVGAVQGPQQVPIHGMDEARTLWTNDMKSAFVLALIKWIFVANINVNIGCISPLQPLMTRPSSAQTLAQVTSQSWPVKMARGVVNSPEITQKEQL